MLLARADNVGTQVPRDPGVCDHLICFGQVIYGHRLLVVILLPVLYRSWTQIGKEMFSFLKKKVSYSRKKSDILIQHLFVTFIYSRNLVSDVCTSGTHTM